MSEASPHSWTCAGCGRRVPLRAAVCHCGTTRERSLALDAAGGARAALPARVPQGWRGLWRSLPRDVKALAAGAVIVLGTGLGWLLLGPAPPNTAPALLGHVDRPVTARRHVPQPAPPFKLPWWK